MTQIFNSGPRLDSSSETWSYVRMWARDKLRQTREDNDAISLSDIHTAALRGRIEAYKEIMDLSKPVPEIIPADQEIY